MSKRLFELQIACNFFWRLLIIGTPLSAYKNDVDDGTENVLKTYKIETSKKVKAKRNQWEFPKNNFKIKLYCSFSLHYTMWATHL